MPHPRTRPGGHLLESTGEKITSADLVRIGTMAEQALYHLLARLCQSSQSGNPIQGFFGADCEVTISAGLTLSIAEGWGFYYDTAEANEFKALYKPIVVSTAFTTTLDARSGSPRIDIVCLAPLLVEDQSESRSIKAGDGSTSSQSVNKRSRWSYQVLVVKGTPSGTPAAPATPSGYLKLANVYVPTSGSPVVADARGRLALGPDLRTEPSSDYAANFVPAGGLAVTAGTGLAVRVASGEAIIQGYRHRYARTALAIATADPSYDRYDLVVADADGAVKVLTGLPGIGLPPYPDLTATQVALAEILVKDNETTCSVTADVRDSSWLEEGSIRDGVVTGKKLSVVPVKADVSVNGTTGGVTIQVKDLDGNDFAGEVDLCLEILAQDGLDPVAGTRFSTVTTGTTVCGVGNNMMILRTNGSGHALTTMVMANSGVAELIRATPMKRPGQVEYTLFTEA